MNLFTNLKFARIEPIYRVYEDEFNAPTPDME
jgi:hypothetical protein